MSAIRVAGSERLLGGAASPHLRPLLAKGGVRERLQRLVERGELVRDADEPFRRLEASVQRMDLVAEPVEPLEDGVELAVVQVLAFSHYR
jgi:hypothetical protein